MSEQQELLRVEDFRLFRGGVMVVNVPFLSVGREEKVAVIGPNGVGKSSLLLGMASLIERKSGDIFFRGVKVKKQDELDFRRSVSFVFQEPLLFDSSVLNNVVEVLRIRSVSSTEAKKRAYESLDMFGVTHLAERSAHKLSGGEAQRVSLARAFAAKPEIIFMDEPFMSLDLPTRMGLAEELGNILHSSGTAAIMATHDRIEAFRIADRLVVMDKGTIVQDGSPAEVLENPVNRFVAAFRRTAESGQLK